MKNKILITGADGFIGSHLVEYLVNNGYSVKALTLYNSFNSWGCLDLVDEAIKREVEVIQGDIRDFESVKNAMKNCKIVINLAALISIPYSYEAPESYIDTNVKGTFNILKAAKDSGKIKVIHTSTSEVYGTAQHIPIKENHPLVAQSPYAATKICADQMAGSFYSSYNLPVMILRPFNTFGPRQSLRAIIPTIISQFLTQEKKLKMGNLSPKRNFNYIKDTIAAFEMACKSNHFRGEVINVGSKFEISIKDTIKLVSDVMDKKLKISSEKERKRPVNSEVFRLVASNLKAKKILGWKPQYDTKSTFKNALQETVDWYSDSENLEKFKSNLYNL
tara:strand:- start:72 stop:1073 length:1002 start_codon:yes stop_codon:yes gene_type:complete